MQTAERQFTSTAGPIQTKRVNAAVRALLWRGKARVELRGIIGGEERRAELTAVCGNPSDESLTALDTIGQQFDWTVTRENYGEIATALELATANLVLPVDDCREEAGEVAQRQAESASRRQEQDRQHEQCETAYAAVIAKRPAGAEALIVAIFDQDDSDSMTDYHNHKMTRVVAIGWRRGKREDFRQLRAAAALFPDTAHLGPQAGAEVEHRENWSMGSGNYVKAGHDDSTGWRVKSQELSYGWVPPVVIEDRLTMPAATPATPATATPAATGAYTIEKHHHTKRGFDMWIVILADRVERDRFEHLSAECEDFGGWYSRQWGKTPGGFAFKVESDANAWAASHVGNKTPATPAPATAAPAVDPAMTAREPRSASRGAHLRKLADSMTAGIELQRRPMTQNPTPKRMKEYSSRRIDSDNAERCQRALYALADAHDAGTIPPELAGLKSKSVIAPLVAHGTASNGYYDIHSTGEYRDKSPTAVALQQLMEGNKTAANVQEDTERAAADKLRELEERVRFHPIPGFFPTPRTIIDEMIERAELLPEHTILEPSAGKGDIADAVRERNPDCFLTCVEIVPALVEILNAKGYIVDTDGDFLNLVPLRPYDRILMNPPFEKGQDAEHIRHAFECLAPGGRLVSVCSSGPFFRSDRKSTEFREFIESKGAEVIDLPADAFNNSEAFRRTGVSTKLVIINNKIPF